MSQHLTFEDFTIEKNFTLNATPSTPEVALKFGHFLQVYLGGSCSLGFET